MRIFYEGWCILERPNSAVTTAKITEINTSPSVATDEMEQAIVNEGVSKLTHPREVIRGICRNELTYSFQSSSQLLRDEPFTRAS